MLISSETRPNKSGTSDLNVDIRKNEHKKFVLWAFLYHCLPFSLISFISLYFLNLPGDADVYKKFAKHTWQTPNSLVLMSTSIFTWKKLTRKKRALQFWNICWGFLWGFRKSATWHHLRIQSLLFSSKHHP